MGTLSGRGNASGVEQAAIPISLFSDSVQVVVLLELLIIDNRQRFDLRIGLAVFRHRLEVAIFDF
jgi:hypothetical protein